jgi:hypothetical protein
MKDIRSIVARFPQHEFEIRRRCARDAHFKSICADHQEATTALRYWQNAAKDEARNQESDRKVDEYTQFLGELESEILAQLESVGTKPGGDSRGDSDEFLH